MEKELLNKMWPLGRKCLKSIIRREPNKRELDLFMHDMLDYARKMDYSNSYSLIWLEEELDHHYVLTEHKPLQQQWCISFIKKMSKEHRLMRYRYNLKRMLRREPTDEEFKQYLKNIHFLEHNAPGINEPDYRVVREAQSRLDSYLDDKEDAFRKAKIRYDSLSVAERFKAGHLLAPRWRELERDMAINDEFLNGLYRKK